MKPILGILILATAAAAAPGAPAERRIEVILDASGSMAGRTSAGEVKIEAAKKAVTELVGRLPADSVLAFRAYGHQSTRDKHDCEDTRLLVSFAPLAENGAAILEANRSLQPRGYTPITFVLGKAALDFPAGRDVENMIVLVSDGKETCAGDPCATAAALAKTDPRLVIHTVGFGVDEATRAQLDCLARAARGRYFDAGSTAELVDVLGAAMRTAAVITVPASGPGWLRVKGADIMGHDIARSDTGEIAGRASQVQDTVKLESGIYTVTFGKTLWKSVEVKPGETTVLVPGRLRVESASLSGHDVIDPETGEVHGRPGSLMNSIALVPGKYEVMFEGLAWPVEIKAGMTTTLRPGTVSVKGADINGHRIVTAAGIPAGEVSATMDTTPLPPGDYVIEIDGRKIPFKLAEGQDLVLQRKR